MTILEQLHHELNLAGYSLTKSRRTVCKVLAEQPPLTMTQLIKQCRPIDRASVYRTVDLLERLGLVAQAPIGGSFRLELSDKFQLHHHHLLCSQCGRVIDLEQDTKLEAWLRQLAHQHGFSLHDHQIELTGRCPDCQAVSPAAS